MRFIALLLWTSALSSKVLANNVALPFEVIHYYYSYKTEYMLMDASKRTIGTKCEHTVGDTALEESMVAQGVKGMCTFNEFAKYIMKGTDLYTQGPHGATIDPGSDVKGHFPGADKPHALYDLNELMPKHDPIPGRRVKLPQAIGLVSDSVFKARTTTTEADPEKIARADMMITKSRDSLKIASQIRLGALFEDKEISLQQIKGNRIWISRLVVDTKPILDLDGKTEVSSYKDYDIDKSILSQLPWTPDPDDPDAEPPKDPFTPEHRRALKTWSETGFPPKNNGK
ncbi:hypothetical protein VE03_02227, partial [Pseudogymnoascus sp. 23342-1-I1]